MITGGLAASIWAPRTYSPKPGDWACACGANNFARRTVCYKCDAPIKGIIESDISLPDGYGTSDIVVTSGPRIVSGSLSRRADGSGSSSSQTSAPPPYTVLDVQKYGGLVTSRWAPRNHGSGGQLSSDDLQIWTRTVQLVQPASQTNENSPPTPKPRDLGLPYEVQHYILAMIQRMLEEACYDFASRWVPNVLVEKNWTCPEAVELSTWKRLLPEILPDNAITPVPNTSVEKGLANAVKIRNSAVHRHLCDNIEIKRMAQQAQNLMAMFSDVTRENKLYHLRIELAEWNDLSEKDPQTARINLERALQEISEKPLDDMDWTPNTVSLLEIGQETVVEAITEAHEIEQGDDLYVGDAMDLD